MVATLVEQSKGDFMTRILEMMKKPRGCPSKTLASHQWAQVLLFWPPASSSWKCCFCWGSYGSSGSCSCLGNFCCCSCIFGFVSCSMDSLMWKSRTGQEWRKQWKLFSTSSKFLLKIFLKCGWKVQDFCSLGCSSSQFIFKCYFWIKSQLQAI